MIDIEVRSSNLNRRRHLKRWTPAEDKRLRDAWGYESVHTIAERMGRTEVAIAYRASMFGLEMGAPQGYEYLYRATLRTGYEVLQLRRILAWAGVKIRPAWVRPRTGSPRRHHVVDKFDVDQAVAKWNATETIAAAARRIGVSRPTMADWLAEAGAEVRRAPPRLDSHESGPSLARQGIEMRVESCVVDAIVRARMARESITDAARRLGVHAARLGAWLRAAGLRSPRQRELLEPDVYDRVVAENRKQEAA